MGHINNSDREYRLLQQRLDQNVTGAPYSPIFIQILKLLFTPEEATIARQIPLRPARLSVLAHKLGISDAQLQDKLVGMAERGLVFDLEYKHEQYIALAPVVIGFFEFTFMRTRDNLPLTELARLFDEYMMQDDRFARSIFQETTQLGRSLVHEEALPADNYTEVLDWEKASSIIKSAKSIGVSLCACRHKASHLGKSCGNPEKTCLTFNTSADLLIKNSMAELITTDQAMRILQQCKELGLAQTADNVQQNVSYMCNCCGCCCGMFQAMKTFNLRNAIVTSNWIAEIDSDKCKGCGACIKACPAAAIGFTNESNTDRKVIRDDNLCLGCGVCYAACKFGGIHMKQRAQRVVVPETAFDKIVTMALERGKLSNFILDDPSRLSHRALGRIASIIENSPPVKTLTAIQPLRSAFLNAIVSRAKKYTQQE